MKAGSMEGLIGASNNIKMVDVPIRVYKEARREGDTSKMERAMGYAGEYSQKAEEYRKKAQEELPKEIKEEQKELEEKLKEQSEENSKENITVTTDGIKVDISEDGQVLSKENIESSSQQDLIIKTDSPKGYDESGASVLSPEQNTISVKI